MRKRASVLSLIAISLLISLPQLNEHARAQPITGFVDHLHTSFPVKGIDGRRYLIAVDLVRKHAPLPSQPILSVTLSRLCGSASCKELKSYAEEIPADAWTTSVEPGGPYQFDMVLTNFGGVHFHVSWLSEPSGLGAGSPVSLRFAGTSTGELLNLGCYSKGWFERSVAEDSTGFPDPGAKPFPSRLPRAFMRIGTRGPTCLPLR